MQSTWLYFHLTFDSIFKIYFLSFGSLLILLYLYEMKCLLPFIWEVILTLISVVTGTQKSIYIVQSTVKVNKVNAVI